jgi:hypothetical protein
MRYLGYKIPVPPKRDENTWDALREQLNQERHDHQQQSLERAVRRRHDLEQEIERLESLPTNPGRQKAIRLLRKQLDTA